MHMRIAQLTSYFNPRLYASNEFFLCTQLTKLGHDLTIYTTRRRPRWQTNDVMNDESKDMKYAFRVRRFNSYVELGIVPLIPHVLFSLLKEDINLIHTHDFFMSHSTYGAIASEIKRVPLIVTQHNDNFPTSLSSHLLYRLDSASIGKFVFLKADRFIALTNDIKLHLTVLGVNVRKIQVIPNAVDTSLFSPNNKNYLMSKYGLSDRIVLFVGRFVPEKGLLFLIKAFNRLVRDITDAKLVLVGTGPQRLKYMEFVKEHKIPNVFFLGVIENSVMPNIYVGANAVVLPSLREPFGNVAVEAMASGVPVIGSYVGGLKETIVNKKTGFHVSPKDDYQIFSALKTILSQRNVYEDLSSNSRMRAVQFYDQDYLIGKIVSLYETCIRRK